MLILKVVHPIVTWLPELTRGLTEKTLREAVGSQRKTINELSKLFLV
jgi:hypothetical protein